MVASNSYTAVKFKPAEGGSIHLSYRLIPHDSAKFSLLMSAFYMFQDPVYVDIAGHLDNYIYFRRSSLVLSLAARSTYVAFKLPTTHDKEIWRRNGVKELKSGETVCSPIFIRI